MSEGEDAQKRYVVRETERYEIDRDDMFFQFLSHGSEYAGRWLKHLGETTDALTEFPGPLSHARDEEASARFGREVRRLLYYGPTRRRSGVPVRILFTVLPPAPDDPPETAESVILLLRLLHGSRPISFDETADGGDKS